MVNIIKFQCGQLSFATINRGIQYYATYILLARLDKVFQKRHTVVAYQLTQCSLVLLIARTIHLHPSNTHIHSANGSAASKQLLTRYTQITLPEQLTVRLRAHFSLHLLHAFFLRRARARHVCCLLPSASLSRSRFRHLDRYGSLLSLPAYNSGSTRGSLFRCRSNGDETLSLFREGEESLSPAASVWVLRGLFRRRGRC